jgi:hypothetical protein
VTLLPAATVVGVAEFETAKTESVVGPTTSVAVAVLFALLGSEVADDTIAVWLITVPVAVPALTSTLKVMVAGVLGARLVSVQVSVASVQVHPAVVVVNDTAVVFAGKVSVRVTLVAVLGPALFTVCV